MSDPVLEIAELGRALPPAERARLVDLLLVSLDEESDTELGEAWDREIERRVAAHEAGEGQLYELEEVLAEARRLAP